MRKRMQNDERNYKRSQQVGCGNQSGSVSREAAQTEDRNMAELPEKMATKMWNDYVIYMERQNRIFRP